VNVTAAAGAVITASVSTTSGGNWLAATLTSATQLTVSINPAGLAMGTYYGAVALSAGGGTPENINVIAHIPTAPPILTSYSLTAAGTQSPQGIPPPLTVYGSGFLPGATARIYLSGSLGSGQPTFIQYQQYSVIVVDSQTVQLYPGIGTQTPTTVGVSVTNIGSAESNILP
jgi:hypothetical protein